MKGMDRYHRDERHMEHGLAYHFVIGNGNGMGDGEIGVGQRWIEDLNSSDPARAHHGAKRRHTDVVRASLGWILCMSRGCRGGGGQNCGKYGQSQYATRHSHGALLEAGSVLRFKAEWRGKPCHRGRLLWQGGRKASQREARTSRFSFSSRGRNLLESLRSERNKAYWERILKNPFTIEPDGLARSGRNPVIESVGEKRILSDSTMTMELHHLQGNLHDETLLVAYLPKQKMLVQADAFHPRPGAKPLASSPPFTVNLVENIRRLKLDVERVVHLHGGIDPIGTVIKAGRLTAFSIVDL